MEIAVPCFREEEADSIKNLPREILDKICRLSALAGVDRTGRFAGFSTQEEQKEYFSLLDEVVTQFGSLTEEQFAEVEQIATAFAINMRGRAFFRLGLHRPAHQKLLMPLLEKIRNTPFWQVLDRRGLCPQ